MIRVGLLGPGRIVERVMNDMQNATEITLTAVASRNLQRAQEAAEKYHIPNAYGSYEEMAQSPDVDLVYIATPHPFHLEQACLMMKHGKHVLCEKPMTVNADEAEKMIACARENGVFLMEAMWTRFMPTTEKVNELIKQGVIGDVRHMTGSFSFKGTYDEKDRAYAPELAGGALLDLGVYPLMYITMLLGWKPVKTSAYACKAPTGVDMRMCCQMLYSDGATAQFFCGMDAPNNNIMTIYGSEGFIEIPEFWSPNQLVLHRQDGTVETFDYEKEWEGHHREFDHAAICIEKGLKESPVVPLEESLEVSRICTELRKEMNVIYPME